MGPRSDVYQLIQQMRDSVRRPLFTEIALDESLDANRCPISSVSSEDANHSEPPAASKNALPTSSTHSSIFLSRDALSETDSQGPFSSTFLQRPSAPGKPMKTWKEVSQLGVCLSEKCFKKLKAPTNHFHFLIPYLASERCLQTIAVSDRTRTRGNFQTGRYSIARISITTFNRQRILLDATYTRRTRRHRQKQYRKCS